MNNCYNCLIFMNIFLSANKFVSQLVEITDALLNFQTYYIFHNFSNFSKNLSSKMKNVSIKLEIVYSIGKRSKHDGCVLSFSFQDIYPSDDERRGRRRKRIQKYIFPLDIEILRASLELFDAGSANPVNFTAQVSMIAESTVYPFFSVPLGKRKFPGRGRESWFRLEGERNFRGRVSSTRLIRIRGRGGGGSIEPSRTDENNGETKSGKKFSDNGAGPRRHVLAAAALEINFDLTMRIPGGGFSMRRDELLMRVDF